MNRNEIQALVDVLNEDCSSCHHPFRQA